MDCYLKFQGGQFSLCRRFNVKDRSYAKRDCVSVFSAGSRRRMLKYLGSSVSKYWVLGTLTYASTDDALSFRQDWRRFVECWRRVYGDDDGNSLFWFVEFQGNGQPHFHFYADHFIEKGWLAAAWHKSCRSESAKHERVGTRIELLRDKGSALRYASKYASKSEQKTVPDLFAGKGGFRWWGIVGNRDIVAAAITVDDLEYDAFGLSDIEYLVKKCSNRLIYQDNGASVYRIDSLSDYKLIFKAFYHAKKVLQQAESKLRSEVYRNRRSEGFVLRI